MVISTTVNGVAHELDASPETSLLHLLRDELDLIGTKGACEQGECGSCAVWLDDELVCSCLVPAVQLGGRTVRTVESLSPNGTLHPVQQAFVETGAVQCGFCTPGMVVAAVDLVERDPYPDEAAIGEALAGHLCRCTGYRKVVEAVRLVVSGHMS